MKEKYEKVIYIGDGVSDFCVADKADFLYAKSSNDMSTRDFDEAPKYKVAFSYCVIPVGAKYEIFQNIRFDESLVSLPYIDSLVVLYNEYFLLLIIFFSIQFDIFFSFLYKIYPIYHKLLYPLSH